MLGLACDNASPNDAMVNLLGEHLEAFEGSLGRVRCFAHVLNLVVKTLLRQFDVPKAKPAHVDAEDEELYDLAAEDEDDVEGVHGVIVTCRLEWMVKMIRKGGWTRSRRCRTWRGRNSRRRFGLYAWF